MRSHYSALCAAMSVLAVMACSKKKSEPVSEIIKKVWTVQTARENGTLVYTKGATSNIRDYSRFRLDLSNPAAASLTDWEGTTSTGQSELPTSTRLVLKNLTPAPTGTNGTIELTINSATAASLDLTRTTNSQKTGGTTNQYVLTNP